MGLFKSKQDKITELYVDEYLKFFEIQYESQMKKHGVITPMIHDSMNLGSESAAVYVVQEQYGRDVSPELLNYLKYEMWTVTSREFGLDLDALLEYRETL